MNFIILDLEATCWEDKASQNRNEIIEIGAVKINSKGELTGEFNAFIRPKINPVLSDFCTRLTTIKQTDIDSAESFETVIEKFKDWINIDQPYTLCSWGFYDKNQFEKDCDLHKVNKNWLKNHISLKHQYAEINKLKKPVGMSSALKREKLKLEGTHHRGIDDAKNIAQIFSVYFGKWKY